MLCGPPFLCGLSFLLPTRLSHDALWHTVMAIMHCRKGCLTLRQEGGLQNDRSHEALQHHRLLQLHVAFNKLLFSWFSCKKIKYIDKKMLKCFFPVWGKKDFFCFFPKHFKLFSVCFGIYSVHGTKVTSKYLSLENIWMNGHRSLHQSQKEEKMLWKTNKERGISKIRHHETLGTQNGSGFYVNDRELLVMYSAADETEWLKSFLSLLSRMCYYLFPLCGCTSINLPLIPVLCYYFI